MKEKVISFWLLVKIKSIYKVKLILPPLKYSPTLSHIIKDSKASLMIKYNMAYVQGRGLPGRPVPRCPPVNHTM